MSRLLFRSIFGQILVLIAAGFIVLQISNFAVVCAVQYLYVADAEQMRADKLAANWVYFNSITPKMRPRLLESLAPMNTADALREKIVLAQEPPAWTTDSRMLGHDRQLERVSKIFEVAGLSVPSMHLRTLDASWDFLPLHLPGIEAAMKLDDGTWLVATFPYDADDRPPVWTQRFLMFAVALVLLLLVAWLLRRITAPLQSLSETMTAFGARPETAPAADESGAYEVQQAARAFNGMRERILGNFTERNRMIAAMAHDLRTPLTKLTLRLERVQPDDLRDKLLETASGMKDIISQGLAFARSLDSKEKFEKLDIRSFLQSVCDDYADVGAPVTHTLSPDTEQTSAFVVTVRPLALRRAVDNLISNALKYAGDAQIGLVLQNGRLVITVSDNGSGIPEEMLSRVFDPYFRVDPSRNPRTGGVGLGLSIARNMVLLNNGELTVQNRPEGGLCVTISLPRDEFAH